MNDISDINKLVYRATEELTNIIDEHAPKKAIKITVRSKTSWTSEEVHPDNTL